jgi:hypothetical protein
VTAAAWSALLYQAVAIAICRTGSDSAYSVAGVIFVGAWGDAEREGKRSRLRRALSLPKEAAVKTARRLKRDIKLEVGGRLPAPRLGKDTLLEDAQAHIEKALRDPGVRARLSRVECEDGTPTPEFVVRRFPAAFLEALVCEQPLSEFREDLIHELCELVQRRTFVDAVQDGLASVPDLAGLGAGSLLGLLLSAFGVVNPVEASAYGAATSGSLLSLSHLARRGRGRREGAPHVRQAALQIVAELLAHMDSCDILPPVPTGLASATKAAMGRPHKWTPDPRAVQHLERVLVRDAQSAGDEELHTTLYGLLEALRRQERRPSDTGAFRGVGEALLEVIWIGGNVDDRGVDGPTAIGDDGRAADGRS